MSHLLRFSSFKVTCKCPYLVMYSWHKDVERRASSDYYIQSCLSGSCYTTVALAIERLSATKVPCISQVRWRRQIEQAQGPAEAMGGCSGEAALTTRESNIAQLPPAQQQQQQQPQGRRQRRPRLRRPQVGYAPTIKIFMIIVAALSLIINLPR